MLLNLPPLRARVARSVAWRSGIGLPAQKCDASTMLHALLLLAICWTPLSSTSTLSRRRPSLPCATPAGCGLAPARSPGGGSVAVWAYRCCFLIGPTGSRLRYYDRPLVCVHPVLAVCTSPRTLGMAYARPGARKHVVVRGRRDQQYCRRTQLQLQGEARQDEEGTPPRLGSRRPPRAPKDAAGSPANSGLWTVMRLLVDGSGR